MRPGTPEEKVVEFQFDQLFDSTDDFDGWVLCWCLAQQQMKTWREVLLRLDLDDPSLDEREAERFRLIHFEMTIGLLREACRLVLTRDKYTKQLAIGPDAEVKALGAELDEMEDLVRSRIGDEEAVEILRTHRDNVFHIPIGFKTGIPESQVKEAMERMASDGDGRQSFSTAGTIGTTDFAFARGLQGSLLALALNVPSEDPEQKILNERLKRLVEIAQQVTGRLDKAANLLLSLQLERKGFVP